MTSPQEKRRFQRQADRAAASTFADQAVIAIENVAAVRRAAGENTDDLERSAAAADRDRRRPQGDQPLGVRPANGAGHAGRSRQRGCARLRQGDRLRAERRRVFSRRAHVGFTSGFMDYVKDIPVKPDRGDHNRSGLLERQGDSCPRSASLDPRLRFHPRLKNSARTSRTILRVPLSARRQTGWRDQAATPIPCVRSPTGRSNWCKTFADQAVIAIENVRLFDEVQAKTRDLTESLTIQTGSSDILRVIASSPTDCRTGAQRDRRNCLRAYASADDSQFSGCRMATTLRFSAHHGPMPDHLEAVLRDKPEVDSRSSRSSTQKAVHVHDLPFPDGGDQFPETQERARRYSARTML